MITGARWRAGGDLRDAATRTMMIGLWLGSAARAALAVAYYTVGHGVGMDAHAYWLSGRLGHPYSGAPEEHDAFLYSPLFAQAMRLVAWLPWPLFCGLLMATCAAVYY